MAGQWRSTGGTPELAWVPSSDGTGRRTGMPKGPQGEARGSTRLDTDPLRPTSEPAPGPLRPRRSQGVSSWSTWLCRNRFKDYYIKPWRRCPLKSVLFTVPSKETRKPAALGFKDNIMRSEILLAKKLTFG